MSETPKPQLARLSDAMEDQPTPPTAEELAQDSRKPDESGPMPDAGLQVDQKQNNAEVNAGVGDRDEHLVKVGRGQHTTGRA